MPFYYEAVSPSGPCCYLTLNTRPHEIASTGAILDALLLGALEVLTRSIEDALVQELNWRTASLKELPSSDAYFQFELQFSEISLVSRAHVMLPLSILRSLEYQQLSDMPDLSSINWMPVKSTLVLSEFSLAEVDLNDLSVGALVLISESFKDQWTAVLHVGSNFQLAGAFQFANQEWTPLPASETDCRSGSLAQQTQQSSTGGTSPVSSDQSYRIEFDVHIHPVEIMKQTVVVTLSVSGVDDEPRLSLRGPDGTHYVGHLLPTGQGQALLLKSKAMEDI